MRPGVPLIRLPRDDVDPLSPLDDPRLKPAEWVGAIYRDERSRLIRFVSSRSRRQDAEDVVQQAFVRLVGSASCDSIASPAAYLRQSASNLIRDDARAEKRRSKHAHVPIEEVEIAGCDPVASLEARDRLVRIEEALSRLKPLTSQIFLACRLDGYSYAEIAQQTGLSVRGVEKQMHRAIKQLGRHLSRHD